jgi:signal transduction histidine kinase
LRALSTYHEKELEEERRRIAREVHDELGQFLTALKMDISLLRLRFGDDPELREKAEDMRGLVEQTIQVVRHVASNLRPAALDLGLVPAIEWLAEDFGHRWEIACRVDLSGAEITLDDIHATAVFRVVQESLTNVARHAGASAVTISLDVAHDRLQLSIRDNGRGFDPAAIENTRSFGLLGMRERMLGLGGALIVDSATGKGTTVTIYLPIPGATA